MYDCANGNLPISFQVIYTLNHDMYGLMKPDRPIYIIKCKFVYKWPQFQFLKLWNDWHGKLGSDLSPKKLKRFIRSNIFR